MNRALALALVALVVPLLGCPYDSANPVAPASTRAIDPRLVGEWHCVAGDSDKAMTFVFTSVSPTELELTVPGEEDAHPMRLHSATLADKPVLNVEDPQAKNDARWSLARATFYRPSLVQFDLAREEPFNAAAKGTSERATAERALKRGELFGDYCACVRAESKAR